MISVTYICDIFSGMVLRISSLKLWSITLGCGSLLNLMLIYFIISSSVGLIRISTIQMRYLPTSSRMCGRPVTNSRVPGDSRVTRANDWKALVGTPWETHPARQCKYSSVARYRELILGESGFQQIRALDRQGAFLTSEMPPRFRAEYAPGYLPPV